MRKLLLLTVMASILLFASPALAAEYKVQKGDTLSKIAKEYGVSVDELMEENELKGTIIKIGQVLHIPEKELAEKDKRKEKVVVSRSADLMQERLKKVIDSLLGTPYLYGGTTTKGFDCSGFTSYVFAQVGVKLPRDSRSQYGVGTKVASSEMEFGDLVFYSAKKNGVISHVGIYVGNNKMAHAATSQKEVKINDLDWYDKNYQRVGVKRVLKQEKEETEEVTQQSSQELKESQGL